jgi:hypothetical protein
MDYGALIRCEKDGLEGRRDTRGHAAGEFHLGQSICDSSGRCSCCIHGVGV